MAGRPKRRRKADRLLNPGANQAEIACDYALAPLDRVAREMDRKWGVDRLPELVSAEMSVKYGRALAAVNAAIDAEDVEACAQNANNCIRGLQAMDAEATRTGAAPASTDVWEIDLEGDGRRIGIMRDADAWPAIKERRPDLALYSLREVAVALRGLNTPVIDAVKEAFPGAQIAEAKPVGPVELIDDEEIGF